MSDNLYDSGFDELEKLLEEYAKKSENFLEILEVGSRALVEDVRRLPSPRSRMNGAGYTHLLDTVTYKKVNGEIEVGWGKYYGPMVERGTVKMRGTRHLSVTFEINKEKYYQKMIQKFE